MELLTNCGKPEQDCLEGKAVPRHKLSYLPARSSQKLLDEELGGRMETGSESGESFTFVDLHLTIREMLLAKIASGLSNPSVRFAAEVSGIRICVQ